MYALTAALVIAGGVFAIGTLRDGDAVPSTPGSSSTPTGTSIPMLPSGSIAAGTYVFASLDSDFDASHRITIDVPDGYEIAEWRGRSSRSGGFLSMG